MLVRGLEPPSGRQQSAASERGEVIALRAEEGGMRRAAAGAPGRQEGRGAPAEGLGPRRGRLSQCSATAHLLRPRRLRDEGSSDRVAQRLEPGRRRQLRGHGRVRLGMHGQRGEAQPTALPSGSSAAPPAVVGSAPRTAHAKALAAALAASGGKLGSSGMGKGFYCDARPMAAGCPDATAGAPPSTAETATYAASTASPFSVASPPPPPSLQRAHVGGHGVGGPLEARSSPKKEPPLSHRPAQALGSGSSPRAASPGPRRSPPVRCATKSSVWWPSPSSSHGAKRRAS